MGGTLRAIERGFIQQEIQNAAYRCQQAVDRKEAIVVGVNAFHLNDEKPSRCNILTKRWSASRSSACADRAPPATKRSGSRG